MVTARSGDSLVTVGESAFRWRVHREPQWCTTDGWKGLMISVEHGDLKGRSLLIELPFTAQSRRSTPHRQRPKVSEGELRAYIAQALAVGWVPGSRGKPFVFAVVHHASVGQ